MFIKLRVYRAVYNFIIQQLSMFHKTKIMKKAAAKNFTAHSLSKNQSTTLWCI